MKRVVAMMVLAGSVGTAVMAIPGEASAQSVNQVTPTGKGIAGCALLGGEAVALIEAAAGARPRWAYILGAGLGAVAGGVGGYFLEQAATGDTTLTGISVGTLVLGLGLAIPTTIAVIGATGYNPESDQANEDNAPSNTPIDESTTPGAAAPTNGTTAPESTAPATTPTPATPPAAPATSLRHGGSGRRVAMAPRATGLLDVTGTGLNLAVPTVSVGTNFTLAEVRQYGMTPVSELRVPVISGSF